MPKGRGKNHMTDEMANIMQMDDAVDALPAIGVKDAYVRAKLMAALCEFYSGRPDGWNARLFKEGERDLRDKSPEGVRLFVIGAANHGVLSRGIASVAHQNRAEDWVVTAFDYMTNDEMADARKVRAARGWLKRHVRGSLGMPTDGVIRDTIRNNYPDATEA